MAKLGDDDLLMVLSDHGFESWRTGFNVNDWLEEQGYLKVTDRRAAGIGFLQGIDWANTKAYSIGLSSMYLNLKNRESKGAVGGGRKRQPHCGNPREAPCRERFGYGHERIHEHLHARQLSRRSGQRCAGHLFRL